jgi:probable F420-dependent oxidoreductase
MERVARAIEASGYGSVWIPDALGREVFVAATVLLEATESLVVGSGVANIWARDAIAMQTAALTLAEAYPDRFILGFGVSHRLLVEDGRGHRFTHPFAKMKAYVDQMDAAPSYAVPPSRPPVRVLAALGPKMVELAGARTDGVHPYLVTPAHTRAARSILGTEPLLVPETGILPTVDPAEGARIARKHLQIYLTLPNYMNNFRRLGFDDTDFVDGGSDRLISALFVTNAPDAVEARIAAHLEAGADHVLLQIIGNADVEAELVRLAPVVASFGRD